MKNEEINKNKNKNKNITKKRKIINGLKYYELNINKDNYLINIINLPKDNLIKFKVYINKDNEINISSKEKYIIYENEFNLDYFLKQTPFLTDLKIKNINDLIRFLYTYFQEYNEKAQLINYDNNNKNKIILKLLMFQNKIQINIELYNNQINNNKKDKINDDDINIQNLKKSNSCKNLLVHKKELKTNNNKNDLIIDYYISIIQKKIPFLQNITKDKLDLIYKSSEEKDNPNFHIKCDDKGPTLIFINTEEKRQFITFNKKSWHLVHDDQLNQAAWRETNTRDDDIVIIDLFSQKIIQIKKKNNKIIYNPSMKYIQQYENYGPSYVDGNGFSFKIFGGDKYLSISFNTKDIEEDNYIRINFNLNKNNFLHIKDYEVYCIKK